jgi:hypothetical protein
MNTTTKTFEKSQDRIKRIISEFESQVRYKTKQLDLETLEDAFCEFLDLVDLDFQTEREEDTINLINFFPELYGFAPKQWVKIPKSDGTFEVHLAVLDKDFEFDRFDPVQFHLSALKPLLLFADIRFSKKELKAYKIRVKDVDGNIVEKNVLPSDVELLTDNEVSRFVDAFIAEREEFNDNKAVNFTLLFDAGRDDQVFYLRQRGIDKETAILFAKAQDCFFTVNVQELFKRSFRPV